MSNNKYDVIVIGGGIGGLVAGCYLVKEGLKVLIVEKNDQVGGYCRSFTEQGYTFNTCIRGFVGAMHGGMFDKILSDLNLKSELQLLRPEVYDEIQFLGNSIALHNDIRKFIDEVIQVFPDERMAIRDFFSLVLKERLTTEFYKYRNRSFQELIDEFFKNPQLKFFLTILRIDSGESPSKTSALADLMLIRGNIIDGGYFPKGGMQVLSDTFAKYFCLKGGYIRRNTLVKSIKVAKYKAAGVILDSGNFVRAKVIISNSDVTFTFQSLLKDANIKRGILENIKKMKPSTSLFILHLALNVSIKPYLRYKCAAIWNFSRSIGDGIVCLLPSIIDPNMSPVEKDSVTLYYGMPFKDQEYWEKNQQRICNLFTQRFLRIFPRMKNHIYFSRSITPQDLRNDTFNRCGASRGWAPSIKQINSLFPSIETPIPNVFLAGHWVVSYSGNGGVAFAAHAAKNVAKLIIKRWTLINKI